MKRIEKRSKLQYIWLLIAAALVGLDRFTKWLVVSNMELKQTINLIKIGDTEVLNFYYCLNDGAAFSRFSGQRILLIIVTSVVIAGFLYAVIVRRIKQPVHVAAASLIISGGIGNLIDRIFNGGLVVDFIDLRIINFAVFNIADICAVVGAGLLAVSVVVGEIRDIRAKKANEKNGEN
ncbi:MAG: signal peptidase II [Oscillospiraceae bacterium]|nr:signal peptidase II [Oscillospiraceae bacterium]